MMSAKTDELRACIAALESAIEEQKRLVADEEATQAKINYLIALGKIDDKDCINRLTELNSKVLLFPTALHDAEARVKGLHQAVHNLLRECTLEARELCRSKVSDLESKLLSLVFGDSPPRSKESKEAVKNLAKCSLWQDWFNAFQSIALGSRAELSLDLQEIKYFFEWLPKFESGRPRR
jgi:hypothetical protein